MIGHFAHDSPPPLPLRP